MKSKVEQYNIPSDSSSRVYVVTKYDDGSYACSCPSWIFKKGQKVNCKHINDLVFKQQNHSYTNATIVGLEEETEMKQNNEGDICAKCGDGKGEVPITDENSTFWICEYCDSDMFDNSIESKGLEPRGIK